MAEPNLSFDGPVEIELGSRTEVDLDAEWNTISTLDDGIDAILGGGLPTGYLCEVTGERYVFHTFYTSMTMTAG